MMIRFLFVLMIVAAGCGTQEGPLELAASLAGDAITVRRAAGGDTVLVHNVAQDFRPYLHPIMTPDGQASVTEFSPDHHRHQTGLYWGFTRLNDRDYFHHPSGDYWQRVSVRVLEAEGAAVGWETVYALLGEAGDPVLTETQRWSLHADDSTYVLDLEWRGRAHSAVIIGEYDYGGLFLRMPWKPGIEGRAVNAARERNQFAEGKRAMWMDVGLRQEGRLVMDHLAIFDHPENDGFPQPWRVDYQLGVGPVRARLGDWTIEQEEEAVIRHRILIYSGTMNDVDMRARWETYTDQAGAMYAFASLWGIAQQEGRDADFLSPDQAAAAMTLKAGYQANAWAGEPMVTQPMAFAWDDRGRLWVAENRDYESRSTGFSGSGDSRIVILEDEDRDGKADKRTVFLEGIAFPSALAVGFEGLFLGAPPHLMFVPDRDRDDRADREDIQVLLTGWGIRDRHETVNSLHWGPDGWLYGLEGFATSSVIRKPGPDARLFGHRDEFPEDLLESEGTPINGGVWRYHPVRDKFEVVAHGFSNPWGIDYDAHGEFFISACVIPHLFHVVPGGLYQRQGGVHFNPYAYQDIAPIVDHRHRSAHGGARVYQSDAFGAEETGRLFMANIHEHAVLSDILVPQGSGYLASHGDEFMMAHNAQWVGFSLEIGPDGALYVLDWHDADICGGDVLDKDTGRIFRIAPEDSQAEEWEGRYDDLAELSDMGLARLQASPSDWHTRRARVLLQHRAVLRDIDEAAIRHLRSLYVNATEVPVRLKAMWSLNVSGEMTDDDLADALADAEPHIRAWAVRLLAEDPSSDNTRMQLAAAAEREDSPVVRKYLATVLQRLPEAHRWELAAILIRQADDRGDPNIPTLLWLGIEPLVSADPQRALELAQMSRLPRISELIARRMVDAGQLEPLVATLRTHRNEHLLAGMLEGLEGMTDIAAPPSWPSAYRHLQRKRSTADLATEAAQRFGDAEAALRQIEVVLDAGRPIEERRAALRSVAPRQSDKLRDRLDELLEEDDMRIEVIRAVAAFNDEALGKLLLERFGSWDGATQQEAIQTLASRPVYGWLLVDALEAGQIGRADIPAWVARQMRRVVGSGFVELWGPIDEMAEDKASRYARYEQLLGSAASGDMDSGEAVFDRACRACHQMNGQGGITGPDLTGANRTSTPYLLSNLIDPDEFIQEDYRMVIVTTRDGRTYVGSITAENDRQVTIRPVGLPEVVLSRADVQSTEVSAESLMPEGMLDRLSEREVIDLFEFMRTAPTSP
ncbi:MAG: PmoA family protein [Bacteroidota bacterium]|nr:PmoA family protein [Bacteroidota bacterium]